MPVPSVRRLPLRLFLAASVEGEFASAPTTRDSDRFSVWNGESMLPHLSRMLDLWDDLETWSVRDRNGELGVFEAVISGS